MNDKKGTGASASPKAPFSFEREELVSLHDHYLRSGTHGIPGLATFLNVITGLLFFQPSLPLPLSPSAQNICIVYISMNSLIALCVQRS
jgi:hypothetical protein